MKNPMDPGPMRSKQRGAAVGLLALALVLLAFAHATATADAQGTQDDTIEVQHEGEDHSGDDGGNFLPGFTALLGLAAVAGTAIGLAALRRS